VGKKTSYVINISKNNYYNKPKENCIETPLSLADFIFNMFDDTVMLRNESSSDTLRVWDIGCGKGNLSRPFKKAGYRCTGIDINYWYKEFYPGKFIPCDFIAQSTELLQKFSSKYTDHLILCNPPFNYRDGSTPEEVLTYWKGQGFEKEPLYPHVFLHKIFEVFGTRAKVVLFVPMGFLRNQRILKKGNFSERYQWLVDTEEQITSILTVPMNMFEGVLVHSDILFWNIQGMRPHYMYEQAE